MNIKIKDDLKEAINIYKKEKSYIYTLGKTYEDKKNPFITKIVYKEHLVFKGVLNISQTSSEYVKYDELIGGNYIRKRVTCNYLGLQNNGKNQYGLSYQLGEKYWMNFYETKTLNIKILRDFNILNKNEWIGYKFKTWVAIKSNQEWNTLIRGENNYQIKNIIKGNSFLILNNKICKMNNIEVYEEIKKNISTEDIFLMQQDFYNHFKNINYYSEKEWNEFRKKQIQEYKNTMMDDKDYIL